MWFIQDVIIQLQNIFHVSSYKELLFGCMLANLWIRTNANFYNIPPMWLGLCRSSIQRLSRLPALFKTITILSMTLEYIFQHLLPQMLSMVHLYKLKSICGSKCWNIYIYSRVILRIVIVYLSLSVSTWFLYRRI